MKAQSGFQRGCSSPERRFRRWGKGCGMLAMVLSFVISEECLALDDGLARVPPMGWNSYNAGMLPDTEDKLLLIAKALVSTGMRDAGYVIVGVDGGWNRMDAQGRLDPPNFPHGMKWMCDTLHEMGLKFGAYSSCKASRGYETIHAQQMAEWGVDYLKYDFCNDQGASGYRTGYQAMGDALKKAGRPIIYNLCAWGQQKVWDWGSTIGHLWRMSDDIAAKWEEGSSHSARSILDCLDDDADLWSYAGPTKGWNDPDVMEVGNAPLTDTENMSHFSLWCIVAAPLIAGNKIQSMSDTTKMILTNKEVIALDQDPLGHQGRRVVKNADKTEVWVKKLKDESTPDWGVVLFNRSSAAKDITVTWQDIAKADPQGKAIAATTSFNARDLWKKQDLEPLTGSYTAQAVPSHGVVVLRLSPGNPNISGAGGALGAGGSSGVGGALGGSGGALTGGSGAGGRSGVGGAPSGSGGALTGAGGSSSGVGGGPSGSGGTLTGAGGAAGSAAGSGGAPGAGGTAGSGRVTGQGGASGSGGVSTSATTKNSSDGCGCRLGGPRGERHLVLSILTLAIAGFALRRRW